MMIGMKMMMLIIKEIYFYVVCGNEILFSKFHKRGLFYMNVKQGREEESLKNFEPYDHKKQKYLEFTSYILIYEV